ncbi:hybrid sensor histidine kinase/response regulator [Massilia orientalis]|uniref:PAS domain S-box protein n=1 Tax=Massilia orientalis TaxID=3050128 RepID=A0ACC7M4P9_9BURK|nr:PAS domain-containing protein [Massilia sp. YIM B02787]
MEVCKWPAGGGETGALLRHADWTATPLGPVADWPQGLRTLVELVLANPAPTALLWGEAGTLIYNDGYAVICGDRHPHILGGPLRAAWPEAWDFNGAMLSEGLAGKPQVYQNAHFVLARDGQPRDAWFDLYYAPVGAGGGAHRGVLATVIEITDRVLAARARAAQADELRTLNTELAAQRARLEIANRQLAGDMQFISSLFQSSPSFMAVLLGPDHRFELTNAAYDRLIGRRAPHGIPVRELLPEVAAQGFVDLLDRVYASGEAYHGQDVVVMLEGADTHDSARRIVDFMYQPLKNADGVTYGILVEGVDVTARALADERLRVAQEAGGIGTFEWYPLRKSLVVSDTYRRLWGIAPDVPVTDDLLLGLLDPSWQQHSGAHRIRRVADPLVYTEFPIRHGVTGERRWIARQGQRVTSDRQGEPRYLGVAFDVTGRKLTEQALRASESRLQTVFEQASVGISETDLDGRFLRVNQAMCRLLGRDAQTLLGLTYRDIIHPDDVAASIAATREVAAGGSIAALDKRYVRADGSEVWGHTGISRLVDSAGHPVSIIAVTTDLTERRRVEAQLRDLNESLERTVSNEVTERIKAERALRHAQKMEAVGQLASGVAHDFNNVLQIISSNLQLVERDATASARQQERVAQALAAVTRGSRLSRQLLAFGRKQNLQPKVTHLGRLLDEIAPLLLRALGDGVNLRFEVAPDLWSTAVDRNQFENAVLNMAINARDAMGGNGNLRIAATNRIAPDGAHVVGLAVTDDGCGMTPEVLAHVFDPFYTTKDAGKGTGLGMSMVYGFVRQSGGTIQIDSAQGMGTTIVVELPRVDGAHEIAREAAAAQVAGGHETVLLVDDDPAVRVVTVDMLAGLGYRVLTAASGDQALDILHSGAAIDLLFSDVSMPGQVTATDLVRHAARFAPGMAVVLTSGHAIDPSLLDVGMPADIVLLPKPYTLPQLALTLRTRLDARAPVLSGTSAEPAGAARTGPLRFLVVEDDPDARLLTCEILEALGYAARGAATAEQALALLQDGAVDVLFTDLNLPGMQGDVLATRACAGNPSLRVILASGEGVVDVDTGAHAAALLPKPFELAQLQHTIAAIESALSADDADLLAGA